MQKYMRGAALPRDRSQLRTSSEKEILRRCKVKGNADDVVVIDVERNKFPDVIIVDEPEPWEEKLHGSSVSRGDQRVPFEGVISIDDEEDDDVGPSGTGVEGRNGFDGAGTSSKQSNNATVSARNSREQGGDDLSVLWEKGTLGPSKREQAYSAKVYGGNRYGLRDESESESSDSDCSDCELIDSSFDKFRELWEKAALSRRNGAQKAQSGQVDRPCASGCYSNEQINIGEKTGTKQHQQTPDFSGASNGKIEKEKQCDHNVAQKEPRHEVLERSDPFSRNSAHKARSGLVDRSNASGCHTDGQVDGAYKAQSGLVDGSNASGCHTDGQVDIGGKNETEQHKQTPDFSGSSNGNSENEKRSDHNVAQKDPWHEPLGKADDLYSRNGEARSRPVDQSYVSDCYSDGNINIEGEHETKQKQQVPDFSPSRKRKIERNKQSTDFGTSESSPGEVASTSRMGSPTEFDEDINHESLRYDPTTFSRTCGSNLQGDTSESRMKSPFMQSDHNVSLHSEPSKKTQSSINSMSEVSNDKAGFLEKEKPSHDHDGDAASSFHKDIINEREKLKETDAYKRAIEEEWASRQQQLQIQAEEAQRLKKRKKAETLRLLDMEKRQKQRVEEVRETQKKDEEHMNLKEQLRVEIRKDLSRLEHTCISMASLLRGLGIPVGGGIQPTSNEVHAAYKRALLKFHPDRASRMDIRQQVEAEEKFKLICRMKEKFLS